MLSVTTAKAYWDELEKISGVGSSILQGGTGALLGSAVGLGGTALFLHGNARQDRLLRDMGVLSYEEAKRRQMHRVSAMVGVASAMGLGGSVAGAMAPLAQKYITNAVTQSTKGMWDNASDGLQRAISEGGEQVARRARKEIEVGLEKQVEHGDRLLKKQMEYGHQLLRDSAPEIAEEVGSKAVKGVLKSIPIMGRFWR